MYPTSSLALERFQLKFANRHVAIFVIVEPYTLVVAHNIHFVRVCGNK